MLPIYCIFPSFLNYSDTKGQRWRNDIILVGGGTGTFYDRQRILEANYDYTPIYRTVARYDIRRN